MSLVQPMDEPEDAIAGAKENYGFDVDEDWIRAVPRAPSADRPAPVLRRRSRVLGPTVTLLLVLGAFGAFAISFAGFAVAATAFVP